MQYRTLGRTGIKVSPYALGTLMFASSIGNPDHDDSIRIIHKALDAGINFVDTADAYGDSEEVVGKALKGRRDDVVLATKFSRPMGDDPNQQGASRRWIVTAVENSLRRLQTDHIDLYQIHRPDPDTDIEETLSALSDLIRSGKVRAIGSSTMPASDIVEAQWVAERRGLERFRTEQPPYSILNRGIEREVLPTRAALRDGRRWSGARSGRACSPAASARASRPTSSAASFLKAFSDERRLDAVEQLDPARRGGGPADDPPRDGVRDRPPGRDQRDPRAAHDGPPRRPARRPRRHPHRRHPRPDRRDRPARHRRRHARPGLRPAGPRAHAASAAGRSSNAPPPDHGPSARVH